MAKVVCSACSNEVELKDGYLRQHRKKPGMRSRSGWCDGGGRHQSFNGKQAEPSNPGDMHEPKPYTGDLDWSAGVPDRYDV